MFDNIWWFLIEDFVKLLDTLDDQLRERQKLIFSKDLILRTGDPGGYQNSR
jgi:hypothetical protein